MATNLRKTLSDAGYITVGLGVMGVQQVQTRARDLRERANKAGDCLDARRKDTQQKLGAQTRGARDRAEEQVRNSVAKAKDLGTDLGKRVEPTVERVQTQITDLGKRVEPTVERVQTQITDLPERVVQAWEPVAARMRELVGTSAA